MDLTDPRWAEVERIVASRTFNRAPRLCAFLTYICRKTLDGKTDEITEQQIGIHVFERAADYNPGDDNIVRGAARQLRQKLAVYYQTESPAPPIRVDVPKGAYIPVFETCSIPASVEETAPVEVPKPRQWLPLALMFVLGIATALAAVRLQSEALHASGPADDFWNLLFSKDRPTLIVVGDAGLNIFDNLARRQVGLNEYISGAYLTAPQAVTPPGYEWAPLSHRRYTTLADLRVVDQFHRLPQYAPDREQVRFARDIRIEDFKGKNVVLVGSAITNPWSELIAGQFNFHISYDGTVNTITVTNRHPRAGESASYVWSERDPAHRGYAHIALTRNPDSTGHLLLIQGTTMAGVNAAADFLADEKRLAAAIARSPRTNGIVEILLEGEMMDGSSPAAQVVAVR